MNLLTDEEILSKDCLDLTYDVFDEADIIPRTILEFARAIESAVLEKLKAQEPFGYYENGRFSVNTDGGPDKWRERKAHSGAVYTNPLPPADVVRVAELEAVLRECRDVMDRENRIIPGVRFTEAITKIDEVLNVPDISRTA